MHQIKTIGRPPFLADGVLVARRELRIEGKTYSPGEVVPREPLNPRLIRSLWEQFQIDTHPEQPAPSAPPTSSKRSARGVREGSASR